MAQKKLFGNSNLITVENKTYDLSQMSPEEKWRLEHMKMHEQHKGHEKMHLEMFLVLISTLVVVQILLVQWKQRHFKSYQLVTLAGMWIIPVIVSLRFLWLRFVCVWFFFSMVSWVMTYLATRHRIAMTTPRRVYTWFLLIYKLSYGLGIAGYAAIMCTLFGLNVLVMVKPNESMDFGLLLLYYGLYFGVVARDFAEVCSDKMASHVGYYTPTGVPTRRLDPGVCAVCGNLLFGDGGGAEGADGDEGRREKTFRLNCSHVFHEFCIRGWCIIGKKDMCPYCKEKVDLKRMFKNPWEKPHVLYGSLLDWIRYLVAWQPLIIVAVQGINWVLGLE